MARTRVRKRGIVPPEVLKEASERVIQGSSVRAVAKCYGICHVTLHRYCVRRKALVEAGSEDLPKSGYNSHFKVFSADQETKIVQYILQAADIFFGLCPREARQIAYQLAKHYNCKFPVSWERVEMAGKDWLMGFMQRHPRLSLHRPKPSSMKPMSFNRHNVGLFFKHLQSVLTSYDLEGHQIWHMDETEITLLIPQVIAGKDIKQALAITSKERETLVTMAIAVSATGNVNPPHFVFPSKQFLPDMTSGGPPGFVGTANGSGRMQEEDFLVFLQHFVHHTGASYQSKVLLLLDNHPSHVTARGIDYCRENGVVLLSFHPQCSHKLQPLNQTVSGPLQEHTNRQIYAWMQAHPGKTLSPYDIPRLVADALSRAASHSNITSGFRCTGIWPFNPNVFTATDFAPSGVTIRPEDITTLNTVSAESAGSISSPGLPLNSSPLSTSIQATGSVFSPGLQPGNTSLQHTAAVSLLLPSLTSSVGLLPTSGQAAGFFHSPVVQPVYTDFSTLSRSSCHTQEAQERSNTKQSAPDIFGPVSISPLCKCGPRKTLKRERRKRSEILIHSPLKSNPEPPENKPNEKLQSNACWSVKTDAEKHDSFCLVCRESFQSSKCGEKWVQCWSCKEWAHEDCTEGGKIYSCQKC